ncbi:MAG: hypothetical protein ACRD8O_22885, partial [Bryobacteraceae bacterium]
MKTRLVSSLLAAAGLRAAAGLLAGLLVAAGTALAAPAISSRGIYNAASYIPFGAPNAGVAQGGMFVIFGAEMGPATLQIINAFPLPANLGGTSVRVTVGGTNVDALMIYTSAGQLAAILPSSTPLGDAEVRVTYNGQTSPPETVRVVRNSFGIFTRNQGGTGPAIAQNFRSATDQPVNSLTDVAR